MAFLPKYFTIQYLILLIGYFDLFTIFFIMAGQHMYTVVTLTLLITDINLSNF